MELQCHVISTKDSNSTQEKELFNTIFVNELQAKITYCPIDEVADTIENCKEEYIKQGKKPYFIKGGGHGNQGTEAYVKAYHEILAYEEEVNTRFDYIFHASGTGTTQAGLICGKLINNRKDQIIVGISIARVEKSGRCVIKESIREYLGDKFEQLYHEKELVFLANYTEGGYGNYTPEIANLIADVMRYDGIPMDTTYVGKAFNGMLHYLQEKQVENKKILFIHTGGTPIFFDKLNR